MALVGPPPLLDTNPFAAVFGDLREERSATVPFPPGDTRFSLARTRRFNDDPLPLLLEAYERYGPVFTLRLFHGNVVFMLGPAANHYMTVSHAANFTWRESHMRELIGLMGDGLLTIDGDFHRRSRLAMLPGFHRERIAASVDVMVAETAARARPARPRRAHRPLHLDPPTDAADRDARTLRPRPRRRHSALGRCRRPVRTGARVLHLGDHAAHVPWAADALGADAAGRALARQA